MIACILSTRVLAVCTGVFVAQTSRDRARPDRSASMYERIIAAIGSRSSRPREVPPKNTSLQGPALFKAGRATFLHGTIFSLKSLQYSLC